MTVEGMSLDAINHCGRCNGTGIIGTVQMWKALAYAVGTITKMPAPDGTMPCPECHQRADEKREVA